MFTTPLFPSKPCQAIIFTITVVQKDTRTIDVRMILPTRPQRQIVAATEYARIVATTVISTL